MPDNQLKLRNQFSSAPAYFLIATASFLVPLSWGHSHVGRDTVAQTEKGSTAVTPEQAEQNLIKKVAPVYPPLAKQVRIQGKVKLQVIISKTGTAGSVNVVSGHPLLVQAAID